MMKTIQISEPINDPLEESNFHSIKTSLYNRQGINYIEFKKTIKPDFLKIWIDISAGWLALAACIFGSMYILTDVQNLLIKICFCITDAILVGFIISYLVNFFHEAAHYNIARTKSKNDRLANIFLGILQAQGIKHYRIVHWKHHIHHGTIDDTERSYFNALTFRFFFENLTGLNALKIFLFRNNEVAKAIENKNLINIKEGRIMLIAGLAFHLSAISVLTALGHYWTVGIWIAGFGIFFPFFSSLRQLLEHRSDIADRKLNYSKTNHGRITRILSTGLFSSIYGSAGFNRHLLHHLEPQISYTNLKQLEAFLLETSIAPHVKRQKTSYRKVFTKLLGK